MARSKRPGETEFTILKLLWDHGPMNVRELSQQLESLGISWAPTTIHTLLSRLKKKSLVTSKKLDGVLQFEAAVAREDYAEDSVNDLLNQLGGGTLFPLVKALLGRETLGQQEIDELKQMVDQHEQRSKPSRGKKQK